MIKCHEEFSNWRDIFQHKKATYDKSIANIILNGDKPRALLKSGTRQGCLLLTTFIEHSVWSLRAVRQEREKGDINRKRSQIKLSLFAKWHDLLL